tara:strand:+ start:209 stop:901 length:693 start_codon:yes stop_codon:yes gene_type:complete
VYKQNIIIALDYDNENKIYQFCDQIDPSSCKIKIGKQVFTKFGPNIINNLQEKKFEIFLDLKFHDIPTTVYKACKEAFDLGVWMLNIHLLGGIEMIAAAKQARDEINSDAKLIGVTLLTSTTDSALNNIGLSERPAMIKKLAELASKTKIDGVVCSPSDIRFVREIDKTLLFVTPGIRLDTTADDHAEVFTPRDAIKLGSNYIVIGRPITESNNPMQIITNIIEKVEQIN